MVEYFCHAPYMFLLYILLVKCNILFYILNLTILSEFHVYRLTRSFFYEKQYLMYAITFDIQGDRRFLEQTLTWGWDR